MKKRINKFIYVLAALVLFATSCDWEPIMWDESKAYIAFDTQSTDVPEEGDPVGIVVMATALDGAPAVDVTFQFDTIGIAPDKAAIEGEQYELLNEDMTLSFPNGWGYDTIWINPLDNDIFTGDKLFNITLVSNTADLPFGANKVNFVTVKDNEHPLAAWIGTYTVLAKSAYGADYDETWTVTTAPSPDDITVLMLNGLGGPAYSEFTDVPAVVDKEALTITLPAGAEIGTHGNYGGPLAIYLGDDAGAVASETAPIPGTVAEDGSILIENVAVQFVGGINTGYVWDSFDTEWTKTSKKGMMVVESNDSTLDRKGLIKQ